MMASRVPGTEAASRDWVERRGEEQTEIPWGPLTCEKVGTFTGKEEGSRKEGEKMDTELPARFSF